MPKKPKRLRVLAEPDPFLRRTAKPVQDVQAEGVKELVMDMAHTMRKENGIGLAAIQVGVDARVIVVETKGGAIPFVNPEIVSRSKEEELGEEGCLSVPGEFGFVKRSKSIVVESLDIDGNPQVHDAKGLFARVIQHEIDHLNGVLFIDRIEDFDRAEIPEIAPAL